MPSNTPTLSNLSAALSTVDTQGKSAKRNGDSQQESFKTVINRGAEQVSQPGTNKKSEVRHANVTKSASNRNLKHRDVETAPENPTIDEPQAVAVENTYVSKPPPLTAEAFALAAETVSRDGKSLPLDTLSFKTLPLETTPHQTMPHQTAPLSIGVSAEGLLTSLSEGKESSASASLATVSEVFEPQSRLATTGTNIEPGSILQFSDSNDETPGKTFTTDPITHVPDTENSTDVKITVDPHKASTFIGPLKVDAEAAEAGEALRSTALGKDTNIRPINAGTVSEYVNGQINRAQTLSDWNLSNQSINTGVSETGADKTVTVAASQESTPLIKLGPAPVDHSWMQQLQSVHNFTETGRSGNVQVQLPLSVHNPQWFAAMADRVTWLASQSIQAAEIHLDPPELGPLQVRIAVSHDQASVNFVSHQASIRDMLDAQLLRLRELFAEEGLSLVDVNVSDRHQQHNQSQEGNNNSHTNPDNGEVNSDSSLIVPATHINHWVDYYV